MANEKQSVKATPHERPETVTPNQLLVIAVEANADPERLDKLMDLQLKWEANQARKAYVVAMAKFRAKCPVIDKTRSVDFTTAKGRTHYNHAGLSEAIEQIKTLMSESGLSHSWRTTQGETCVTVRCIVTHIEGHNEDTSLTAPPDETGSKNSIQAIASTVSYLERYTLFALLGLASQDMDDDGAKGADKTPQPDPQKDVTKIIEQTFFNYTTEHADEVAAGFMFDGVKFKGALQDQWKKLPKKQKDAFKNTQEEFTALSNKVKVEDCLTLI